jgi:hypothetical protein
MCRLKLDSGEGRLAEAGCTPGCEMERPIAFIHISKTGGSSVCEALEQCKLKPSQFPDREAGKDEGAHQHTWRDYLAFAEETDADMRNAVAFAVVRDPYARMVSWFYYLLASCYGRGEGKASDDTCKIIDTSTMPRASELLRDWGPTWGPDVGSGAVIGQFQQWLKRLDALYPVGSKEAHLFSANSAPLRRADASQVAWLEDESGEIPAGMKLLHVDDPRAHPFEWTEPTALCPKCGLDQPKTLTLDEQWEDLTETMLPECRGVVLPHERATEGTAWSSFKLSTTEHFTKDGGEAAAILEAHVARDFENPRLNFTRIRDQPERPKADAREWILRLHAIAAAEQRLKRAARLDANPDPHAEELAPVR